MVKEKTKTFELQGRRWQVEKVTALDGSNIIRKFTSSGSGNPQDFLSGLSNDEFSNTQKILLSKISEVQNINNQEMMIPIITPSGVISSALSEDAGLTYLLTVISLSFSMSGFFDGNALTEFQEVVKIINA
jgi:hypothetical protein